MNAPMRHDELPPEEEALLQRLARRQHESEDAESRLVERYGNRAALAKQVWSAIVAIILFVVFATGWVLGLKADVERNGRDIQQLRLEVNRITEIQQNIRLELRDKADKKYP